MSKWAVTDPQASFAARDMTAESGDCNAKWGLYRAESDASAPRDCPHLARVYDWGTHPRRVERNRGLSLRRALCDSHGLSPLPLRKASRVARRTCPLPGTVPAFPSFWQPPRTPRSSAGSNSPGNCGRTLDSNHQGYVLSVPASNGLSDPPRSIPSSGPGSVPRSSPHSSPDSSPNNRRSSSGSSSTDCPDSLLQSFPASYLGNNSGDCLPGGGLNCLLRA